MRDITNTLQFRKWYLRCFDTWPFVFLSIFQSKSSWNMSHIKLRTGRKMYWIHDIVPRRRIVDNHHIHHHQHIWLARGGFLNIIVRVWCKRARVIANLYSECSTFGELIWKCETNKLKTVKGETWMGLDPRSVWTQWTIWTTRFISSFEQNSMKMRQNDCKRYYEDKTYEYYLSKAYQHSAKQIVIFDREIYETFF